jgi:predicted chitinase
MVNYAPDFLRFKQPYDPFSPTPDALPIRSPLLSEARANAVPVVKNWSHPFKDNRNPLQQLTHLGEAVAGFYPLGASGLWHGGIHFDGGTAGTLDQSSVHCLADGEVVAYRIDRHSPTTKYWVNNITVNKPFSRNFVLVRHRLQLPKVESSEVEPPSLIFYSLYMHLQDWAVYEGDEAIARPPFWSEGATRYVKPDVNDMHIRYPDQQGLNVRAHGPTGPILDLALRGSQVKVSGEGDFRKLENTSGPDYLKDAEGALRGYISADYLRPIADGQYRIHCATKLNIRAEPRSRDQFGKEVEVLGALPNGTEVTVSGEGAFRKLEHINQYVHYPSLQGKQEPLAQDQVVVLDQPVPIKAGDLIGHIGLYQDQGAQQPERKLHLEVFSGDDVEVFIKNSRAWAQRLPATSKTWLKLAKGTPVVAHQEHFSPQYPPTLSAASTPSDADLQIPKSLLDDLPAELKITVPAAWDRKTCNWYRLDGLLHDANNTLLKGWVCEEVGVTPWVSPWEWDGYDALFNFDPPRLMLASYLRIANRFDDVQLERFGPIADAGDKGPIKERLYDIIDRNRDGQITAAELRAALSLPAHAQSISQLIFHSESEWYHTPKKWDALDELLGHSGSTPNLNWLAEKERIKQLSWWSEVAGKVGLQESGKVYHFHPLGMSSKFMGNTHASSICKKCSSVIHLTKEFFEEICGDKVAKSFINSMVEASGQLFRKYDVDSCDQIKHLLAQAKKETGGFVYLRESLNYSRRTYTSAKLYRMAPTAINAGFARKGITFANESEKLIWIDENLIGNDAAYGEHCFGSKEQPGKDFRGRGLIHLTHYETYKKCAKETGLPIDSNPELLETDFSVAIETALWFWKSRNIATIAENISLSGDAAVIAVTRPINTGLEGLSERQRLKREISPIFNRHFRSGCSRND